MSIHAQIKESLHYNGLSGTNMCSGLVFSSLLFEQHLNKP